MEEKFICPSCGRVMQHHIQSGYDSDHEWLTWWWYDCSCGTKTWYDEFEEIPEQYQATEKQIKTASWIAWELNLRCPPNTKRALHLFIKKYIDKALKKAKYRHEHYDEDDYGYELYDPEY